MRKLRGDNTGLGRGIEERPIAIKTKPLKSCLEMGHVLVVPTMAIAPFVAVYATQVLVAVLHAEPNRVDIWRVDEPVDVPPPARFKCTECHLNWVVNRGVWSKEEQPCPSR